MGKKKTREYKKIILKFTVAFVVLTFSWVLIVFKEDMISWTGDFSSVFMQVVLIGVAISLNFIFISKGILKLKDMEDKLSTNEKLYQHVINNTTMGLWKYDLETRQCVFPPNWKKYLGYEESDLDNTMKAWRGLVHKDDIGVFMKKYQDYCNKVVDRFEMIYRLRRKDGNWIWVEVLGTGLWSSEGKLKNMMFTHTDQTFKMNAQKELTESEEKFRTLFNNANDVMVLIEVDEEGIHQRFLEINDMILEKYGYTRDEVLNMHPFDFILNFKSEKVKEHIKELIQSKSPIIETVHITKNGDRIPVEISNHRFELSGKKVVLCIARDITERKKAEEKLRYIIKENENLLSQAIESERVKTEFFCNISHEFKTPLNIIFGIVQLIERNEYYAQEHIQKGNYHRYIRILKQNCLRILRLVNNLLEINKIDTNYIEMSMENLNIVSLVEEITLSVVEFVNNKGLTLIFDTSSEEKVMACDAYKIERIMLNLLSNSIKYSKPDTCIYVNIQDNEDNVLISVRDTGIGIPKEKLGTIFNRFTRVDSSLTRECEGSGIGLSIVKSYVELHGGKIRVESEYGSGTEFVIELPVSILPDNDKYRLNSYLESNSSITERINIEFSDIYSD